LDLENTGLEVLDLAEYPEFAMRPLHARDISRQAAGISEMVHAIVQSPGTILQELVNAAVSLCGADSAGISMAVDAESGYAEPNHFHWVATAGVYGRYLDALLPRVPSACVIALERGQPQLLRATKKFFDLVGVQAAEVTDGLLLPWEADGKRGTIWVLAHGRREAFDREDLAVMQMFANLAEVAIAERAKQAHQRSQWAAVAAAAMSNELAVRINDPLQELADRIFVAINGKNGGDAQALAAELSDPLATLSRLVEQLLGRRPVVRPN
jgi:GAF domain-containing protein